MKLPSKQKLAVLLFVVVSVALLATMSNNKSENVDQANNQTQSESESKDEQKPEEKSEEKPEEKPADPKAEEEKSEETKAPEQKPEEKPAEEDKKDANEEEKEAPAVGSFSYVAQPGDSYSKIARKAVQTFGITQKVNLSQAQIVYAETMITRAANSPELNQGQSVTISESTVKDWVTKAQNLSDKAQKAWQAYTVGVDFNTNAVGQNR